MPINRNDPLHKPTTAPLPARELFDRFSAVANGFGTSDVATAAVNLLVNVIRQQHASRSAAEKSFDEMLGRAKNVLLEQHYDLTGKRRNVFPFHQIVEMQHFDARKKTNSH